MHYTQQNACKMMVNIVKGKISKEQPFRLDLLAPGKTGANNREGEQQ
jgi:hypothetical protein